MRGEILFKAAQLFAERKEQFARDMTREMGKVLDETRGDVQEAIDMTFYMAGEGRRQFGQTVPSELRNKFAMSVRQPLGVCAIITPWNFPDGDPVVEDHPGARLRQHRRLQAGLADAALGGATSSRSSIDAGVPKGVVNLVTGDGADVGDADARATSRPKVVSFTGSTRRRPHRESRRPRRRSRRSTSRWAARTSS